MAYDRNVVLEAMEILQKEGIETGIRPEDSLAVPGGI